MKFYSLVALLVILATLTGCSSTEAAQAANLPTSQTAYIENKGSDTIVNLALA
jgi:uncharacterized lipoprotein YmbA